MHVVTREGTATIATPDGAVHTVPYTALGRFDMLLQARYHRWAREHEYRRALVCRLCKDDLTVDSDVDETEDTWKILMVCQCRAFYGTIALSAIASAMTNWHSSSTTKSDS